MTYHQGFTVAENAFRAFANCNPDAPDFADRAGAVWRALNRAGLVNDTTSTRPIRKRSLRQKPCAYPFPMATVEFADGMSFLFAFYSLAGKPLDWSHAERVAIGHWQARKLSAWRKVDGGDRLRPSLDIAGKPITMSPETTSYADVWGCYTPLRIAGKTAGSLDDQRVAEAAFLRRNPPPAIVRMVEAHGTREQLAA
jgi:hypothetical protein